MKSYKAHYLRVSCINCMHMYSFASLIRKSPSPMFSDTAITNQHSNITFSSSKYTACGYPHLLGLKQDLSMDRIARLSAPCPSHKTAPCPSHKKVLCTNFNIFEMPKPNPRVRPWGIVFCHERLCYNMIMFQYGRVLTMIAGI